jgi:hypothetical protein
MTQPDPDLLSMAHDELDRACSLSWRDLCKITPWGDEFEGVSPAGRDVLAARSYIWAEGVGGDVLCEVTVYAGRSRHDFGVTVGRIVPKRP